MQNVSPASYRDDGQAEGLLHVLRDGVITVSIDRPQSQNALTPSVLQSIRTILRQAATSGRPAVIVLTGTGEHFCSGYDIRELESGPTNEGRDELAATLSDLEEYPSPVIAAVRGNCVGSGLDLALACDFRIADGTARFTMPPAKLGIVYPWVGVQRLVQAVGPAWARFMLYTAEPIDAAGAFTAGLVQRVVQDDLLGHVAALAAVIANERAPLSIAGAKLTVRALARAALGDEDAIRFDLLVEEAMASADHREALRARREHRAPVFWGR